MSAGPPVDRRRRRTRNRLPADRTGAPGGYGSGVFTVAVAAVLLGFGLSRADSGRRLALLGGGGEDSSEGRSRGSQIRCHRRAAAGQHRAHRSRRAPASARRHRSGAGYPGSRAGPARRGLGAPAGRQSSPRPAPAVLSSGDRGLCRPLDGGLTRPDARTVLAAAPTPAQAAKLTPARLRRLLTKAGRKRNLDRDIARLREVLSDTYLHQPPAVENAMGIHLTALLGQFEAACTAADALAEAAIAHFEQHPDAEIITSFPGLGMLTGARVLAEIGDDRSRFADARGLKAFAGSAPITRASGKKTVVLHRHIKNRRLAALRPDLGAGIAARLPWSPPPLRRPPRRRRLEPPSPTTPFQQVPRPTPPLPTDRPALQRTLAFPPPLQLAA